MDSLCLYQRNLFILAASQYIAAHAAAPIRVKTAEGETLNRGIVVTIGNRHPIAADNSLAQA